MNLSEVARKKLSKLLPRLSSDQDGERLATLEAIARTLKNEGQDWHDLTTAIVEGGGRVIYRDRVVYRDRPKAQESKSDWQAKADYCVEHESHLRSRETDFVHDMQAKLRFMDEPTEKQAAWLEAIYCRLRRHFGETEGGAA